MTTEKDYVERLEKIIDKQDALLSQLDAKFNQQDSLNEAIIKQNNFLKEDIQKHKNLTRDMNKTVTQQKNVVAKLKKELEDQLKIQQDLHKDYGEVIKQLTDDLEEEQNKNEALIKRQKELESEVEKLNADLTKVKNTLNNAASTFDNDSLKDKVNDSKCPNCGAEVQEGFAFCDSCGTKL
ncbi:zinc-ribbon domain-containing protein [Methanobrevibacter sp.]|uniref:zinc-ribbon domain-containing protein n=1 Tax=Methanobrevibacter sp. TaxID=66852 RepID=UPI002E75AE0A|nr:zinc-ribbon domain-containing protein [Methanobrevibacter sp.]MEE0939514.1 zinc-ribbon domain-containing protein [Methanobrevibacter sp.]